MKSRLQSEVDREPTMAEWASAAGLSCQALKWQVRCGNNCRERIIYANSRMVVHIAKKYCGRGLNLEDLLQVQKVYFLTAVVFYDNLSTSPFPRNSTP